MTPFRRGGGRKRRDANEPAIIDALRKSGCQVWQVSGTGLPDLLCLTPRGDYVPLEVKTAKGTLTKVQAQQAAPWPIVRSVDEAMQWVQR